MIYLAEFRSGVEISAITIGIYRWRGGGVERPSLRALIPLYVARYEIINLGIDLEAVGIRELKSEFSLVKAGLTVQQLLGAFPASGLTIPAAGFSCVWFNYSCSWFFLRLVLQSQRITQNPLAAGSKTQRLNLTKRRRSTSSTVFPNQQLVTHASADPVVNTQKC
ncbi:NB-ARC domain containing protein [Dorcoceras hygrometricum]|uniref:NB-ARC domain containing protein n=1 Tax=Dorcoceras hygrometricum TaxID=472368 RepID=A0A2Z7AIL3_9LAMI|nr:NB-ARC domain containing protein [Dorcoceras hygrometricum]